MSHAARNSTGKKYHLYRVSRSIAPCGVQLRLLSTLTILPVEQVAVADLCRTCFWQLVPPRPRKQKRVKHCQTCTCEGT